MLLISNISSYFLVLQKQVWFQQIHEKKKNEKDEIIEYIIVQV